MWETFSDVGIWAVRKVGDKNFNSQDTFHVQSKEEATSLCALLNGYENVVYAAWNVVKEDS